MSEDWQRQAKLDRMTREGRAPTVIDADDQAAHEARVHAQDRLNQAYDRLNNRRQALAVADRRVEQAQKALDAAKAEQNARRAAVAESTEEVAAMEANKQ